MARRNTLPSYRLHKATGQAVVTLGGHDVYLGRHDTPASREAYERALIAWKAHGTIPGGKRRRGTVDSGPTVGALLAAFWRGVEGTGRYVKRGEPTTERRSLAQAFRPLLRMFGAKPVAAFRVADLLAVRDALAAGTDGVPLARSTVNRHVLRIRHLLRWGVIAEMVPVAVYEAVRAVPALRRGHPVAVDRPPVGPANLRDVAKVLRVAPAVVAAVLRLQWHTGMRPGEAVQLHADDVDRSRPVWLYRPRRHKTEHRGRDRVVPLGPKAQRLLAPFLAAGGFAFRLGRGAHLSEGYYYAQVVAACAKAGVPRFSPAQLRHNAATRFRSVASVDVARTVLGHSDAGMTLHYAEADMRKAAEFAGRHG